MRELATAQVARLAAAWTPQRLTIHSTDPRTHLRRSIELIPDHSSVDEKGISKIDISALAKCESLRVINFRSVDLGNVEELRQFSEFENLEKLEINSSIVISNPPPAPQHTTLAESIADEARYIETKVRWHQIIETTIEELKAPRRMSLRGRF